MPAAKPNAGTPRAPSKPRAPAPRRDDAGFPGPATPAYPPPPRYPPPASYPAPGAPPPSSPPPSYPPSGYPQQAAYPAYPPQYPPYPPMQWRPVQESLWKRIPPAVKQLLKSYLFVLAGALLIVGLLFVLNIFIDFGGKQFNSRAIGTFFVLLFGWGWGILGAFMMFYRPLRPAGAAGLMVGVAFIIFGSLAVWETGKPYDLWNIPWALLVVQVALAAGVVGWIKKDDPGLAALALATIAVTALSGVVIAYLVLDVPSMLPSDRVQSQLGESASLLGFFTALASVCLLIPQRPEWRVARWLVYAAPAELAVMLAAAPWLRPASYAYSVDRLTTLADRWVIAAWVIAAILILMAATAYIIAKLRPESARA